MSRTILHADLNCFYASVECLLDPAIRHRPVAVCGSVEARHGIVLAKNYLAKPYGIKTGMAVWEAKRLCPDLVTVEARHSLYLRYARRVREIYARYTDRVEPFGLDEAWLDVSGEDGKRLADELRQVILRECGLTVSIGVSDNKVYAKLGSDYRKPDATTVFLGDAVPSIVYRLPVSDLLFVGHATADRLHSYRIDTIGDLARADEAFLKAVLGKNGVMLGKYARGEDDSPVRPAALAEAVKSIGHSTTLPRDIKTLDEAHAVLTLLSEAVAGRLREHQLECRTVSLYLRQSDLKSCERQTSLACPTDLTMPIRDAAERLLRVLFDPRAFAAAGLGVRSLGVRASLLSPKQEETQLTFDPLPQFDERERRTERVLDDVRRRFGYFSLRRASMLTDPALTGYNLRGGIPTLPTAVNEVLCLD